MLNSSHSIEKQPLAHLGETLHTLVSGLVAIAVVGAIFIACLAMGAPR